MKTCLILGCDCAAIEPTTFAFTGTSLQPIIFKFCLENINILIEPLNHFDAPNYYLSKL